MSVLLWLAILPLYDDPDGPMYPPIVIDDRWLFGERTRLATQMDMQRAYKLWQSFIMTYEQVALWHADRNAIEEWRVYASWLHRVYDKLDDLTLYRECPDRLRVSLTELRRLLGPINYYRGIVPPIPALEGM